MLPPGGIVEVKSVGGFVILFLQVCEKVANDAFFGPIAVHPCQCRKHEHDDNCDGDPDRSPAPRAASYG